ncbi:MAG: hypothetical protein GY927_04055 [bacterium]|nr:hypothetical protein [bacterium]
MTKRPRRNHTPASFFTFAGEEAVLDQVGTNTRYLYLAGALLSYRYPNFIALNEPDASPTTDLIARPARMIKKATFRTNIWIVTHGEQLTVRLSKETGIVL